MLVKILNLRRRSATMGMAYLTVRMTGFL